MSQRHFPWYDFIVLRGVDGVDRCYRRQHLKDGTVKKQRVKRQHVKCRRLLSPTQAAQKQIVVRKKTPSRRKAPSKPKPKSKPRARARPRPRLRAKARSLPSGHKQMVVRRRKKPTPRPPRPSPRRLELPEEPRPREVYYSPERWEADKRRAEEQWIKEVMRHEPRARAKPKTKRKTKTKTKSKWKKGFLKKKYRHETPVSFKKGFLKKKTKKKKQYSDPTRAFDLSGEWWKTY